MWNYTNFYAQVKPEASLYVHCTNIWCKCSRDRATWFSVVQQMGYLRLPYCAVTSVAKIETSLHENSNVSLFQCATIYKNLTWNNLDVMNINVSLHYMWRTTVSDSDTNANVTCSALLPKIRADIDQHIFVLVNICVGCQ